MASRCVLVLLLLAASCVLLQVQAAAPAAGLHDAGVSSSTRTTSTTSTSSSERHMQQRRWRQLPRLLQLLPAAGGNGSGDAQPACEPWSVPSELRCEYVTSHADLCYPNGGWQAYLRVHFCTFQHW